MKPVLLISGGSEGLGKAMAQQLASAYTVVILARNPERTKAVAHELGVDYVLADVCQEQQVCAAVEEVIKRHGSIYGLINNAGMWTGGTLEDAEYTTIAQVIDINYKGAVFLSKAVIPHMKAKKSGYIINIISSAGLSGKAERTLYNSSKFALSGFTKSLQPELAPHGIRVTGLYPGPIQTELFAKQGFDRDMEQNGLTPIEVANTVAFVLSQPPHVLCTELMMQHINY